ncbi:hypothetical protein BDQ17DRAFT_1353594 [Cyathus striatus]|nr:hypothetical protein BDQ17DRAFT_1353594 [Cyathus striatus]
MNLLLSHGSRASQRGLTLMWVLVHCICVLPDFCQTLEIPRRELRDSLRQASILSGLPEVRTTANSFNPEEIDIAVNPFSSGELQKMKRQS